jgi:hypothetical protein
VAGISEQLADAIFDALTVAAPGGAGVHRARQDVIGIEECPAVVVSTPTESAFASSRRLPLRAVSTHLPRVYPLQTSFRAV